MRLAGLVAASLAAASAAAAPKIDSVTVKPNPAQFSGGKPPEVTVAVTLKRGRFDSGGCDARVEFGDGQGRSLDFDVAETRTVRHSYKKSGSYMVSVKGAGRTPCEGAQQAAVKVVGGPEGRKKSDKKKESE